MAEYFQMDYLHIYQVLAVGGLVCKVSVRISSEVSWASFMYARILFVLLQGFNDCGPPPIIPGWNILPLLTVVSPDLPGPFEEAGDDDISPGWSRSQEERPLPAILRIPHVSLPQFVSESRPFRIGSFTLRRYIFQRLSVRFLPRTAKVLLASRRKDAMCGGDHEVPQSAEIVYERRSKGGLQRDSTVWKGFGSVRVCFVEILRDRDRVGDIHTSRWVVNGRKGVTVAPIRVLGCRRNAEFLAEWFNVRKLDPLSFIRNPLQI